jgi:DNA invertase Pin-like site-specific DNA recombinase
LRVSTARQGQSGLGLEAQREAIERHRASIAGKLIAEFKEIESGKRNDRPQLAAALAACRAHKATLCIARLDRLSRNVHFLSGLMEAGVDFVACDMPQANRLTLHVLAAVAEHEREMISARTKAALKAAKERGVRLGNPRLKPGTPEAAAKARARKSVKAQERARDLAPMIQRARREGANSLRQLAAVLNENGIPTPAGRERWSPVQVARVVRQIGD